MDETERDHQRPDSRERPDRHEQPDPSERPDAGQPPAELIIREPEDLLGYIPHAMGEWPTESLVAVTVGSGTVGVTVRVDLPPGEGDLKAYAEAVRGYLATDPLADGAVLVVYTAQPWSDVAEPPRHALMTELQSALAESGLPVLDAWLVGERHWRSMLCRRSSCCPWPGERLETIAASRLGTELVFRGSTYEGAVGGPPRAIGPRAGYATRPASGASKLAERYRVSPRSWWDPREFAAALAAWDETLGDPRPPGSERLSLLAASLARPALRDAVIVAAALGGRAAWRGTLALGGLNRGADDGGGVAEAVETTNDFEGRGELPELPGGLPAAEVRRVVTEWAEPPEASDRDAEEAASLAFGGVLLGNTSEAPGWDRIARLERVVRTLAATEEPEVRAPALAMLGWIYWVRGRGATARGFLRRALSAAPGYRFAELFLRVVESGELAEWARRPETAWRRLSDVA
ncbi:DUF4192 domain-containing protein [Sinomonas sp. G460-2]|uniref:DUF4192 domain-containing protein n=1 Tax=Sinomonas sp. G460-2 TaxID=3393464 RepID=UPI0039F039D2